MKSARLFSLMGLLALFFFMGCNKPSAVNSANNGNNASASPAPGASASPSLAANPDASPGSDDRTGNPPAGSAPAQAQGAPPQPLVIQAGRTIIIRLAQPLSSKDSHDGDSFSGSVAEAVEVDGQTVIARGAAAHGRVVTAKAMGHFKGGALLQLRLDSVSINGERRPVVSNLWSLTLKGKGKRSAVLIGGGAGVGAALGGIFGGGKGAAIGALAGGGAGTAGAAYTGNKEIQLPAESPLTFRLKQSIQVQ